VFYPRTFFWGGRRKLPQTSKLLFLGSGENGKVEEGTREGEGMEITEERGNKGKGRRMRSRGRGWKIVKLKNIGACTGQTDRQ